MIQKGSIVHVEYGDMPCSPAMVTGWDENGKLSVTRFPDHGPSREAALRAYVELRWHVLDECPEPTYEVQTLWESDG